MNLSDIELVNFVDLTTEEKLMILKWRNDKSIRVWMYNSENITEINHLKFIESLKEDIMKKYFLVKSNNQMIGVIYFIDIDKENSNAEFGIYSNPILKGVGQLLMSVILQYTHVVLNLNTLRAEVFSENLKGLKLYSSNGFKQMNIKNINNKKVICMEMKNETR